jgi:hypothetical protein
MLKKSSSPGEPLEHSPMTKRGRPPSNADRKRQFRETARDILHMAKVKRQFGEAVDTAGAVARAMEQAYRLGFEDALKGPAASEVNHVVTEVSAPSSDAMNWTLIPPRTRSTFWSICLAALGREGRTETPSYLEPRLTPRGTLAWQLVVPDRRTYEKSVGDEGCLPVCAICNGFRWITFRNQSSINNLPYRKKWLVWGKFQRYRSPIKSSSWRSIPPHSARSGKHPWIVSTASNMSVARRALMRLSEYAAYLYGSTPTVAATCAFRIAANSAAVTLGGNFELEQPPAMAIPTSIASDISPPRITFVLRRIISLLRCRRQRFLAEPSARWTNRAISSRLQPGQRRANRHRRSRGKPSPPHGRQGPREGPTRSRVHPGAASIL